MVLNISSKDELLLYKPWPHSDISLFSRCCFSWPHHFFAPKVFLLSLLLLVAMTYKQVQSFQINDFANHYMNIKITGYRLLYRKSIAGRDVDILISWLGTAVLVDCFNRVFKEYINLSIFISRVQTTLGYAPEMSTQLIFKVF